MKQMKCVRLLLPLLFFAVIFLDSCHVLNPNIMLHAGRKYPYDSLTTDSTVAKEFIIGSNDIIEFRLFANDGFKMVDIIGNATNTNIVNNRQNYEYTLDNNGTVKLPIIGVETLKGLGVREAETYLEQRYSDYYVHPFVIIKIVNKRITIYPGEPGQAKVIALSNNNTTVLEALALAGGISSSGKAYNVKLIRQTSDPKKPVKVYKLDLSSIKGLPEGNTIVQSGDIIYVEPRREYAKRTLNEVAPTISLLTSLITVYYVITKIH
ncbi:MAG: polysaccharide biosynthesis/export family protein [Bacteroidetes bacterium]|nr:polysaccharide biosynthesis/export family protein [Bacteroidota bacterium]